MKKLLWCLIPAALIVELFVLGVTHAFGEGYDQAQHDVAAHWYRHCREDAPYEDKKYEREIPPWCGMHGGEMREFLGFSDRWPKEMP